jgi:DMSO/TMAO reductase YedYZ heme-binding membrane subunit
MSQVACQQHQGTFGQGLQQAAFAVINWQLWAGAGTAAGCGGAQPTEDAATVTSASEAVIVIVIVIATAVAARAESEPAAVA